MTKVHKSMWYRGGDGYGFAGPDHTEWELGRQTALRGDRPDYRHMHKLRGVKRKSYSRGWCIGNAERHNLAPSCGIVRPRYIEPVKLAA